MAEEEAGGEDFWSGLAGLRRWGRRGGRAEASVIIEMGGRVGGGMTSVGPVDKQQLLALVGKSTRTSVEKRRRLPRGALPRGAHRTSEYKIWAILKQCGLLRKLFQH